MVSGVFQTCFTAHQADGLLDTRARDERAVAPTARRPDRSSQNNEPLLRDRSRLGFGLDRCFYKLDNLSPPPLVLDFRERPDQPQQLYFFGHGSLLAVQRMSGLKDSQMNPELNLKGSCALRSSTLRPAFSPLPERRRRASRRQPLATS